MNRVQGNKGLKLVECTNKHRMIYVVRWDVQPYEAEDDEMERERSDDMVTFYEHRFQRKPMLADIKEVVLAQMNEACEQEIASGYEWKGKAVWLSTVNQQNYKAAYDLAVQSGGKSLPVVFKFGAVDAPEYYEFATLDELQSFYEGGVSFITETLKKWWAKKDAIDWSEYEGLIT